MCSACQEELDDIIVRNVSYTKILHYSESLIYHVKCAVEFLNEEIVKRDGFFNNIKYTDQLQIYKYLNLNFPIKTKEYKVIILYPEKNFKLRLIE